MRPKFSEPESGHVAHEMTELVERLSSSCCLLTFKTSEKSLSSLRCTVVFKKPCFCLQFILMAAWIIYIKV